MKKFFFIMLLAFAPFVYAEELPDITPDTPVVVPAQAEKVYNKLWMKLMVVRAMSPSNPATISFQFVPYDGGSEVLQEPMLQNTIPDVFALANKDPQFAQVFGGVLAMVNKYKNVDFSKPFEIDAEDYHVIQNLSEE